MNASVNGTELYYQDHGQGWPVLFIHGFPLSGELWAHCVKPLENHCRLIIPDLRGMGQSKACGEPSMATYVDDLAAVLDEIGESKPAVVVGMSMGGYLAFEFFRRHQARVRAIVLVDTRAEADDQAGTQLREETARKVLSQGSRVVAEGMKNLLFGPDASQELRRFWFDAIAGSDPKGVAAALLAMKNRDDSLATLEQINVPSLIVIGKDDILTPLSHSQVMHDRIAGSRLEIVDSAGHMTPAEQPEKFSTLLKQFIDGL